MKFVLEINCDNAAFDDDVFQELSHILRIELTKMEHWIGDNSKEWVSTLVDHNGNKVGTARLTE